MSRIPARLALALLLLAGATSPGGRGASAAVAPGSPPAAGAVRVEVEGNRTRVVVELDRPVAFRTLVTPRPPRLVVDLPEVAWPPPGGAGEAGPRGLVTGLGRGLFAPGRSRLVLDVAAPFRVARQLLLPPSGTSRSHRLVLELEPLPTPADRTATAAADRRPPPVPIPRPATVPPTGAAPAASLPAPPLTLPAPATPATDDGGEADVAAAAAAAIAGQVAPGAPPTPPVDAAEPSLPVVVIDPGHGGVDPGAVGVGGVLEKAVVLDVALDLRDLLRRSGRYRPVLTREGDAFLRLRERVAQAREADGAVFVSLHADSLGLPSQRGASVYTLSPLGSDEEADRLASKENKADILAGTDLSHHDAVVAGILIDLAQRDTNNRSIAFADLLAEELARSVPVVHGRRRSAAFAVLKSPDIPSVLVELGFLSNPEDVKSLSRPDHRAGVAEAVLRALDRHFGLPRS